ncbi:MAG: hypothetical protein OXC30_05235, partial [Alphaproteobacteria bacterium]|nr:hypothetical protein [Alphaproteobacteria bacterium]
LINQTAQWHSGPVIDERVCLATNVGGEAGGACMQDRLNPAAELRNWRESVQDLFPQGESNDEVALTGDSPNIENDSTSYHSQQKKSLNDDAQKTMSGRSLSQQQYPDAKRKFQKEEALLRAHNDVAAIFRYQICLRSNKRARAQKLIKTEECSDVIAQWQEIVDKFEKEIDELHILENGETNDMSKEQRLIRLPSQTRDPQSRVTDGQNMVVSKATYDLRDGHVMQKIPNPSNEFVDMEELRKLTNYKVLEGEAVPKSSQSRVTCGQDMADGPLLAGPVSGDATSDDTGLSKFAETALKRDIAHFLNRGEKRASKYVKLLRASQEQRRIQGQTYSVRKDVNYGALSRYRASRRSFLLSQVQKRNVTLENINQYLQGMKAEYPEATHLLKVSGEVDLEAKSADLTVASLAWMEHEKSITRKSRRSSAAHQM